MTSVVFLSDWTRKGAILFCSVDSTDVLNEAEDEEEQANEGSGITSWSSRWTSNVISTFLG